MTSTVRAALEKAKIALLSTQRRDRTFDAPCWCEVAPIPLVRGGCAHCEKCAAIREALAALDAVLSEQPQAPEPAYLAGESTEKCPWCERGGCEWHPQAEPQSDLAEAKRKMDLKAGIRSGSTADPQAEPLAGADVNMWRVCYDDYDAGTYLVLRGTHENTELAIDNVKSDVAENIANRLNGYEAKLATAEADAESLEHALIQQYQMNHMDTTGWHHGTKKEDCILRECAEVRTALLAHRARIGGGGK